MSAPHTPGPWVVDTYASGPALVGAVMPGTSVRSVVIPIFKIDSPADERLIATSPELLALAQRLVAFATAAIPNDTDPMVILGWLGAICADAKTVVAKATGGDQ